MNEEKRWYGEVLGSSLSITNARPEIKKNQKTFEMSTEQRR